MEAIICYAARCVHFTVPSGRTGASFFLRGQMYLSGSPFTKKISMISKYIKKKTTRLRQTAPSLVLLV